MLHTYNIKTFSSRWHVTMQLFQVTRSNAAQMNTKLCEIARGSRKLKYKACVKYLQRVTFGLGEFSLSTMSAECCIAMITPLSIECSAEIYYLPRLACMQLSCKLNTIFVPINTFTTTLALLPESTNAYQSYRHRLTDTSNYSTNLHLFIAISTTCV